MANKSLANYRVQISTSIIKYIASTCMQILKSIKIIVELPFNLYWLQILFSFIFYTQHLLYFKNYNVWTSKLLKTIKIGSSNLS